MKLFPNALFRDLLPAGAGGQPCRSPAGPKTYVELVTYSTKSSRRHA
jgi:hypothetical protein